LYFKALPIIVGSAFFLPVYLYFPSESIVSD